MSVVVSTWPFSRPGVEAAAQTLQGTKSLLDSVEKGIKVVEEDPAVTSAGYGGLPNALGQLQLDAALMTSDGQQGAVMAMNGFRAAIPAAHQILLHSPHPLLCGMGARSFASHHGLRLYPDSDLLTKHANQRYREFLNGQRMAGMHESASGMPHSDTVGMIACDDQGSLVAGCASSGMQFKLDGRVGDSPVFGAGLYADSCGAAVASGDGDKMLRYCLSFLVVERMRYGDSPALACRHAIQRFAKGEPSSQAAVLAVDSKHQIGAACTQNGFDYVSWSEENSFNVVPVQGETSKQWKHSCV